ncbi:tetratricopeptide repeat-containing hybrid sensor histidine kinase/response regulator [Flavobacterium stagni]|uniref:histidine kinase n=1 Tax=Flavobacterium stagni TaxID=2506421 RepID=A0A4Q1KAM8_9FLAO|nr:ATP-binding protein [Flavobacterium stagni]RXR22985.1 response regulator [Flavobacterium stagni]
MEIRSGILKLLDESYVSRINNLEQSIQLANEALQLAQFHHRKELIAKSYSHLSLFHMIKGDNDTCTEYANISIELYQELEDDRGIADAKYAIAGVMYKTNNYHLGLVYLVDALGIYKKHDDYHNISRCEKTLGTIYEYFEDIEKAVESYENAIEAARKINDIKLESNALTNLSSIWIKQNDLEKADAYIEASIIMKNKADDIRGLAFALYGKAKVLAAQKQFESAENLFHKSIEIHTRMGEKMGLSMAYHKLSKLYYSTNNMEMAKRTLDLAFAIIDKHNITLVRFKCYYLYYKIYKSEGDISKALNYLEYFMREKEAVLNTETLKVIDKYDILVKMKTMEREAELQRERAEMIERNNRVEEAARVRQEFLSTMSHEIRTPLNAITTIINMLGEEHELSSNPMLEPLKFSANHLMMVINDILDFTKLDMGKVELDLHDCDLCELMQNLHQTYYPMAEDKAINLVLDLDENIMTSYEIDATKLTQIVGNLVNNAIKFTEKGTVKLKVELAEIADKVDTLYFEISDTGEGIESHKLHQVFESFTQVKNTRTRKAGGTGLGLAIVKNLVALYGGSIQVSSEYGKGSIFYFSIPLKKSLQSCEINYKTQTVDFDGKSILLVEDNSINAMIADKLLSKWGFSVFHVMNGKEAVMESNKKIYDFILMDIHMPEMDGFEAARYIRKTQNLNQETPIFGLTADVSAKDNTEYQELFTGFLYKPLEVDRLKQVLVKSI